MGADDSMGPPDGLDAAADPPFAAEIARIAGACSRLFAGLKEQDGDEENRNARMERSASLRWTRKKRMNLRSTRGMSGSRRMARSCCSSPGATGGWWRRQDRLRLVMGSSR